MEKSKVIIEMNKLKYEPLPKRTEEEIKILAEKKLKEMTLSEKIGQLFQTHGFSHEEIRDKIPSERMKFLREGKIGSVLNELNTETAFMLQYIAVNETRLGIPLYFGADICVGYKTVFPVCLAMAGTFDPKLVEEISKVSAYEASKAGVNLTFSPMVDLVRDPRWGRVVESNGEDPYLNYVMAGAYVRGYEQNNLSSYDTMGSCVKHFAGYGASEAGRDYNTVDMSERHLRQFYLSGYKACVDENVSSVMSAFNVYDGIPASGNKFLLKDILRDEWKYKNFVLSDYTACLEMIDHKTCSNEKDVAEQSIKAGIDQEMVSMTYIKYLEELVKEKKVEEKLIDEACLKLLEFKYKVGLFDNPFKNLYVDNSKFMRAPEAIKLARKAATKSIVLLKNEKNILPLNKNLKIALIGPKADERGQWDGDCQITLADGLKSKINEKNIFIAKGCEILGKDKSGFEEAVEIAKKSDVIILAMGESSGMTGEAQSRAYISIPGVQNELIAEIKKLNKPTILVSYSGRPIELQWHHDNLDAIVHTWFLGHEAGNAIADVLFGDENPSGKLAMSFPVTVGQIPVYYNQFKTGRPLHEGQAKYVRSCFTDIPNEPLYPFGYGLSYTKFKFSNLKINKSKIKGNEKLKVEITIKNIGDLSGEEVVQLYIECKCFSVTRPLKELKRFQKVNLDSGEEKTLEFYLGKEDLSYYNKFMEFTPENTDYIVYVGNSSRTKDLISAEFSYEI